ncbi:hypothetical protein BDP27DRAFT_1432281 [Rhodocollybia butyracea]|uniref:F-box domain-containing protein n=1 Tax=Rhodocollybia butyracea TaxID=206335 RepID=A0A9P5TY04_9AGAR|nr:hypothetical protein BDP27DRAFT_1432281 [Rhodocollybia butyracea]
MELGLPSDSWLFNLSKVEYTKYTTIETGIQRSLDIRRSKFKCSSSLAVSPLLTTIATPFIERKPQTHKYPQVLPLSPTCIVTMAPNTHIFNLPNEIFLYIFQTFFTRKESLAALATISKRTRRIAYRLLYHTVTACALSSLSTSATIDGEPSAASYIRNIFIENFDFPNIFDDEYLLNHLRPTLSNVARNEVATLNQGRLSKLSFKSFTLPICVVLTEHLSSSLLDLTHLELRTPFPQDKIRLCTSLYTQLCSRSLTYFNLDFLGVSSLPDYTTISKILRPLPHSSSLLRTLKLNLGTSQHYRPMDVLQLLFDDDNFYFHHLKEFFFESADQVFRLKHFLLRHPGIEKLGYRIIHSEYIVHSENTLTDDFQTPQIVPNITEFTGSLINALHLCMSENQSRPIRRLMVHCRHIMQYVDDPRHQLDSLRNATNIRELCLTSSYRGYNLDDITSIILVCPQLSHFGCMLSPVQPTEDYLSDVYSVVLNNLPHIEIFEVFVNHFDDSHLLQHHANAIARAVILGQAFLSPPFHILVICNYTSTLLLEFIYGSMDNI